MRTSIRSSRRGLTLLEMIIAMSLTLLLIGAAIPVFTTQTRSVDASASRSEARQNAQFAVNAIDRELRMVGIGVVGAQPMIVFASPTAISFNADLVSRDPNDATAVYYDPDADPATIISLARSDRIQMPASTWWYPDTSYYQGAGPPAPPGTAETITYWVQRDSSSPYPDEHVLWRRVNNAVPRLVARGLVVRTGEPVFRYLQIDSLGRPKEILQSTLPLTHFAPVHSLLTGSRPDTGKSARTDSIRTVRVRLLGRYRDPRTQRDVLDTVETQIRLMNAGLHRVWTCGEAPLFAGPITALPGLTESGDPSVQITFAPALDENGGEVDVERYLIFRRLAPILEFSEPLAIIPAGQPSYTYTDTDIESGTTVTYGVAAQDCSPKISDVVTAPAIIIP
jgi:type II secretory pathway pseudopilin PulG